MYALGAYIFHRPDGRIVFPYAHLTMSMLDYDFNNTSSYHEVHYYFVRVVGYDVGADLHLVAVPWNCSFHLIGNESNAAFLYIRCDTIYRVAYICYLKILYLLWHHIHYWHKVAWNHHVNCVGVSSCILHLITDLTFRILLIVLLIYLTFAF